MRRSCRRCSCWGDISRGIAVLKRLRIAPHPQSSENFASDFRVSRACRELNRSGPNGKPLVPRPPDFEPIRGLACGARALARRVGNRADAWRQRTNSRGHDTRASRRFHRSNCSGPPALFVNPPIRGIAGTLVAATVGRLKRSDDCGVTRADAVAAFSSCTLPNIRFFESVRPIRSRQ